jgi:hypothetical protein
MAFEGVARRRPLPAWPFIVLGGALIVALILFFVLGDEPERLQGQAPRENTAAQAGYAGALTDIGPLVAPADRSTLEGREVALEGVQVLQVLGERTFLIGPSMSQKALVYWQPEGDTASTPAPKIDAGDTVAVHGVVRPLPTSAQTLADWRIHQMSQSELTAMQVAVVAKTVVETAERSGER